MSITDFLVVFGAGIVIGVMLSVVFWWASTDSRRWPDR